MNEYDKKHYAHWHDSVLEHFTTLDNLHILHESSDYSSWSSHAARDCNFDSWIAALEHDKYEYLVLYGGYNTRIIVARLVDTEKYEYLGSYDGFVLDGDALYNEYGSNLGILTEDEYIENALREYIEDENIADIILESIHNQGSGWSKAHYEGFISEEEINQRLSEYLEEWGYELSSNV